MDWLTAESIPALVDFSKWLVTRAGTAVFILVALYIVRDAIRELFRKKGN
jgi:hypothetical protein